ncbi:MAG: FMN-binding protein [Alcanivorax sp.]|nr:FMN-binding protein [Alcanivorax sp.]
MRVALCVWLFLISVLAATLTRAAPPGRYLSQADFLQQAFAGVSFQGRLLVPDAGLRQRITALLGHPLRARRLHYWQADGRTAWVIDEIGRDEPITLGIVVGAQGIEQLKVLAYRETRGGEVTRSAFLRQFNGASLNHDQALTTPIDGITGATLSVHAVTRAARLALLLTATVTGP